MATNSFFGGELRPDQERYARLAGGMASPLWIPFMAAASMGAAWWMMQNWPRVAGGMVKTGEGAEAAGRTNGLGAPTPAPVPAPAQAVEAVAAAARSFSEDVAAPLTESLAVQGADAAEAKAVAQPAAKTAPAAPAAPKAQQAARAEAAPAPAPAPKAEAAPAAARPKNDGKSVKPGQDRAVSKLLAAAAADHPEPELPPHEGLPPRKKGGKGKKNGG